MLVRVLIPRILQDYADGQTELHLAGRTVGETLDEIMRQYPGLYVAVCDERGEVRRHINLFLNDHLLDVPEAFAQSISPGDTLSVFQAVSGG